MTINIAISVSEGLVMAADSLSQISVGDDVHSLHQSVEKITEIRGRPIAVMINGLGEIEKRTIISLIRQFEFDEYQKQNTPIRKWPVSVLTSNLSATLQQRYDSAFENSEDRPSLGVIVGGYSWGEFFPELFEINFAERATRQIVPSDSGPPRGEERIKYWGHISALERIYRGYDPIALSEGLAIVRLKAHLADHGEYLKDLQTERVKELLEEFLAHPTDEDALVMERLRVLGSSMEMQHRLRGMPLQEAVEFADYLGQTAIGYDRFCQGNPAVGGKLDVVAIQPDGLHWYRRKPFLKKMARARQRTVDVGDRDQMRDMMTEAFAQVSTQMNRPELKDLVATLQGSDAEAPDNGETG
jgi:hypothetical protein